MDPLDITAIKNNNQYQQYLKKVERLMDNDPPLLSPEGKSLEKLTILIEDYESKQGWGIPMG